MLVGTHLFVLTDVFSIENALKGTHKSYLLSDISSSLVQINRVLIVRICIYLCNELIEETAGRRKLIFGMWEFFGYGSSKF